MPNFSKFSNYDIKTAFSQVVFGAESPLLEVELNEAQQILSNKISSIADILGKGVYPLKKDSIVFNPTTSAPTSLTVSDAVVIGDGGIFAHVKHAEVQVNMGDYVYFKLEEVDVTSDSVLKEYGNTNAEQTPNTMVDSRYNIETSRRKVIKHTLVSGYPLPTDTENVKYVSMGQRTRMTEPLNRSLKEYNIFETFEKEITELDEALGSTTDKTNLIFGKYLDKSVTSISDWNSITKSGFYVGQQGTNEPPNYMGRIIGFAIMETASTGVVIAFPRYVYGETGSLPYIRYKYNNKWSEWRDSGQYNNKTQAGIVSKGQDHPTSVWGTDEEGNPSWIPVDDTLSDASSKPVQTKVVDTKFKEIDNSLDLKAPIESPVFTGYPKAPTPLNSSDDTSIATTAYVKALFRELIGDAPDVLDTIEELAKAFKNNDKIIDVLEKAIEKKADKTEIPKIPEIPEYDVVTKTVDGLIPKGQDHPNSLFRTDADGNPAWMNSLPTLVVTDWNEATQTGFYVNADGASNAPAPLNFLGIVINNGEYVLQMLHNYKDVAFEGQDICFIRKGKPVDDGYAWLGWNDQTIHVNSKDYAGIVPKSQNHLNQFWVTDKDGNPMWGNIPTIIITDWNNVKETGFYGGTNVLHSPGGSNDSFTSGFVIAQSGMIIQYVFSSKTASVSVRFMLQGIPYWGNWGSIDTWIANSKTSDGYVKKGTNNPNSLWGTDSEGNPNWRPIDEKYRGNYYGECDTEGSSLYKEVTVDSRFVLEDGVIVTVRFLNSHTGSGNPMSLNVNNTGNKQVTHEGSSISGTIDLPSGTKAPCIKSGTIITFRYCNNTWNVVGSLNADYARYFFYGLDIKLGGTSKGVWYGENNKTINITPASIGAPVYEENTWSPTKLEYLSFNWAEAEILANSNCKFRRVGDLVYVNGTIVLKSNIMEVSKLRISGLPYNIENPNASNSGLFINNGGITFSSENGSTVCGDSECKKLYFSSTNQVICSVDSAVNGIKRVFIDFIYHIKIS